MYFGEHLLQRLLELLVLRALIEFADEVAPCLERIRGKSEGCVAEVLLGGFTSAVCEMGAKADCNFLGGWRLVVSLTMLPAWSLKLIPLVFINL